MYRSAKGRKSKETASGDSKQADEPSNCIICLEKVACRGKLSVCNHWFCFPCILEWSENTNTCPICKARFRCITKVHLDPFRSPPTKVRVGDKDQRVWNDDDDLVAEDVLDTTGVAIDSDDVDDDYEPPNHVENPWTQSTRQQNDRRGNSQTSRQLHLDDYDLEDSFIDDTDEALQAYLHSTYSQQALDITDEYGDERDSEDSSDDNVGQRTSPYRFRNRRSVQTRSSRNTRNAVDSLPQIEEELPSCPSPTSTDSFIVSDDESSDELNKDWAPSRNHSNNSRNKGKSKAKVKNRDSKTRRSSETSRPNSRTRRNLQSSHRPKRQKEPKQRCTSSKRKRQMSASEDEFQQGTSSRNRSQTSQQSIDGWINTAAKRAKTPPATSSTSAQRTVRERACKGKRSIENEESSNYDELYDNSSSESEVEVLSVRIKQGGLKATRNSKQKKKHNNAVHNHSSSRTCVLKTESGNKKNKFREQLKSHYFASASTSTSVETQEDACSDDDDLSNVAFIQPTPQPDKKRSIFTRRQHRSPNASFDHLEDHANNVGPVSQAETRPSKWSSTEQAKTVSIGRALSPLADMSNIQVVLSPLVKLKKNKQQRKRLRSLSSDDE